MEIHYEIEQGTNSWFAAKAGKPSTSSFSKVMANGRGKDSMGVTAHKYAKRLAAERVLGVNLSQDDFTSSAMERGTELEPMAREYYKSVTFKDVLEIGGISNKGAFCSTDGLVVGESALIEIKCPLYPNQLEYLLAPDQIIDTDYKWQLQGELFVSERARVDVISYHPAFGDMQLITSVERDKELIEQLENRLIEFEKLIRIYEAKLRSLTKH